MFAQKIYKLMTIFLVISLSWLSLGVSPARAEAPANDDFDFATPILGLPFSDAINTSEATLAFDDPLYGLNCSPLIYDKTVWYSFTALADTSISISTSGSDYLSEIQVFTGARGSLNLVANICGYEFDLRLQVIAGTTYYVMAPSGHYEGDPIPSGGNLMLTVTELQPPANDDFANATVVNSLPFMDNVNTEAASSELNEPAPCWSPGRSIWYAITPQNSGTFTASVDHWGFGILAAYSGDALENLTALGCVYEWGYAQITLPLQAGTTYYFQTNTDAYWGDWNIRFSLDLTPPPNVSFGFDPYEPSKIDLVYFQNYSGDPGGMPLSAVWDFGDGVTSTEWSPSHHYPVDGDYLVQLTVTAEDGRSATFTQIVQVRTHDVAITRFTVPQSASAGQTRQITVYVNNKYYDENVQVHLFKSSRYGYVEVGTLTLWVPARPSNQTVAFAFSYTFTPEDAVTGKVTFRAVAELADARDAVPADNEAIALPTRVNR